MREMIREKIENSSCISGYVYDTTTQILSVQFHHGGIYDYPNVEKEVVEKWKTADSKGKYFNQVIKKYSVNQ